MTRILDQFLHYRVQYIKPPGNILHNKLTTGREIYFGDDIDKPFKKYKLANWDIGLQYHLYSRTNFIELILKYETNVKYIIDYYQNYTMFKIFHNFYYNSSRTDINISQATNAFLYARTTYKTHIFFTTPYISRWIKDNLTMRGLVLLMEKYFNIFSIEILYTDGKLNFQSFIDKYLAEYAK